eukprot:6304112-Amphidinium_carterae.1
MVTTTILVLGRLLACGSVLRIVPSSCCSAALLAPGILINIVVDVHAHLGLKCLLVEDVPLDGDRGQT